jgi:hydroxyacylglutathione hydrolase
VNDGDELRIGELLIRVLFTPGHTPEHVSYVVVDSSRDEEPFLVFTGGDLLVGAVGRPDLLGRELGQQLAPQLYESVFRKILPLGDHVIMLPTHGGGSLCGKGIANTRLSTIGYERRANSALKHSDKDTFVSAVLSGNPGIPTYYARMRPTNLAGPVPLHAPDPRPLHAEDVEHLAGHGAHPRRLQRPDGADAAYLGRLAAAERRADRAGARPRSRLGHRDDGTVAYRL